MGINTTIEEHLAKPHIYNFGDGRGFVLYNPVKPFTDDNGTVVAQLTIMNGEDDEIETSNYYSRAWCYWNFADHSRDEELAIIDNYLVEQIMNGTDVDMTIDAHRVLVGLDHGLIPDENPFWQQLVVSLAYNAITDTSFFEDLAEYTWFSAQKVQSMLDLAAGAVLQNPNFRLTGFRELNPK